ncbi:uncharacterized protein LOC143253698 isoform X3 [Tachypleus tridentatus]|uniref:uncharacterized protein LOC143253698 isoform X3 n=1 Tax=Tachypleus tridentatus TaxID=6853 RepID=UPI003FD4EDB8
MEESRWLLQMEFSQTGLVSQFCTVEALITGIVDKWASVLRPRRKLFTIGMVIVLYLLGLPMVTELLDLFMTWDWATYFHDYGQENSKYLRVNPQVAVVLLEKRCVISRNVLTHQPLHFVIQTF